MNTTETKVEQPNFNDVDRNALKIINGNFALLDLLYDINRLPEQLEHNSKPWVEMVLLAHAFERGQQSAKLPNQSAIAAAREALKDSVKAAEYVVRLIEQTGKAGVSPNPMEKADWLGAAMHCYAAMSFIQKARQALERLG
jgi:hypothetical protein